MIVITGGAGFLGSNLLHALNAADFTAIALVDDLGTDGRWQQINTGKFDELIPTHRLMDWLNANRRLVEAVVHLGGPLGNSVNNIDQLLEAHYHSSIKVWDWCTLAGVPFLYASTAATYGMGEHGFKDSFAIEHLEKLRPVSPYGFAKHQFDKWVASVVAKGEARPPQVVAFKFFNVFGPHEYFEPGGSLVQKFLHSAQKHEPCELLGDGSAIRDFISVDDAMAVVLHFLGNPKVSGMYNVGTGKGNTFFELASAVYQTVYNAPLVKYKPLSEEAAARFPLAMVADTGRLRASGFKKPFTPLETAVQQYIENFLAPNKLYR